MDGDEASLSAHAEPAGPGESRERGEDPLVPIGDAARALEEDRPSTFDGGPASAEFDRSAARTASRRLASRPVNEGFVLGLVLREEDGRVASVRFDEAGSAWSAVVEGASDGAVRGTVAEALPELVEQWTADAARVVELGESVRFERRCAGSGRRYEGSMQPAGPDRFASIFTDVTARWEAERFEGALLRVGDALRDAADPRSAARTATALVGEALAASRVAFAASHEDSARFVVEDDWRLPGMASLSGSHPVTWFGDVPSPAGYGEPLGRPDERAPWSGSDGWPGTETDDCASTLGMAMTDRGRSIGTLIVQNVEARRWSGAELLFVREAADRLQTALERIEVAGRQALVNGEIAHRLKNLLAMVQSIVFQTFGRAVASERLETFEARMAALGRAHDVLLRRDWEAADLDVVAEGALSGAAVLDRCSLVGPTVRLRARAALSVSLLIHELATNAVKHGALGVLEGRVDIAWSITEGRLELEWRERGGPPACAPVRLGFGSRLIGMGLAGRGGVELSYSDDGLLAVFRSALREIEPA